MWLSNLCYSHKIQSPNHLSCHQLCLYGSILNGFLVFIYYISGFIIIFAYLISSIKISTQHLLFSSLHNSMIEETFAHPLIQNKIKLMLDLSVERWYFLAIHILVLGYSPPCFTGVWTSAVLGSVSLPRPLLSSCCSVCSWGPAPCW